MARLTDSLRSPSPLPASLAALLAVACGDSARIETRQAAAAAGGDAVMVAVNVLTGDEPTLYVGAYPDLPATWTRRT